MKALVYPIVHITTSTICGTDLHILKGDLPGVTPGRILGHEGIGVVMEVGTAVTAVRPERVLELTGGQRWAESRPGT
jgi:alcohol dehydrogenase